LRWQTHFVLSLQQHAAIVSAEVAGGGAISDSDSVNASAEAHFRAGVTARQRHARKNARSCMNINMK
jgi:hypothetical protein